MNAKAYAEMSVATVLYGLTFPLTTMALGAMGPLYLSLVRSLWSFIFFIVYSLMKGYPRGLDYALLLGISVFGMVLSIIFQNVGMLHTTASMASIIQSTAPIFVIFLAFFLIGEKLTFLKMLGALIGIIGTIIVMSNGAGSGNSTMFGDIMMLCSAASLALLAILEKLALSKYSPIDIIGITSILGFPMLLLIALPLEQPPAFTLWY
jgi:drug/metabolite transporter (DMT)-like permease